MYSQRTEIDLSKGERTLAELFSEIEAKSEFIFFYNDKAIDLSRTVRSDGGKHTINYILDRALESSKVRYEIVDRQVIFYQASPDSKTGDTPSVQQDNNRQTVTGTVTDSSGEPIIGANVIEKGSSNGTITDIDGKFTLDVASGSAVLSVSYIGYTSREIAVGSRRTIDILLDEDSQRLDEIVVVGYGTMKKSDLTGAVVSIKMADKDMAANVNITQALQGYMAGVNVGGSSRAGESGNISIRGQTSFSASMEPLIVVDEIIYNGSLTDIDVNDIEKIDILKDASAAAVYGSRSANGVIIISTKRGQSDKPLFNFNMYYGYQDMGQTKRTKVMNGDQYAVRLVDSDYYIQKLMPWYQTNPTSAEGRPARPDITDRNIVAASLRTEEERKNYLAGNETDWIDKVYSPAPIRSYNLSVSGNSARTNYYLSGAYTAQDGIVQGDDFKRLTLRANFENKVTDWLSIRLNTQISNLDYSGYYNTVETVSGDGYYNEAAMIYALRASPLADPVDANGNYPIYLANEKAYMRHPLTYQYVDDSDVANRLFYVLTAKVDVPWVKGLRYEINYSQTHNTRKTDDFFPSNTYEGAIFNNYGMKVYNDEDNWLVNNIVSYSNTFNQKHSVNGTLLYSAEKRTGEGSRLDSYGFQNPVLGFNALQLGETQSVQTSAWEEASISYMARLNYAYDSKYLFTATYRRDGYSGFGKNKKYAGFPSVSAAWVISREDFLGEAGWLDHLKLRLSYGLNGNQGIGRYASLSRVSSTAYVFDASTAVGVYPSSMGNPELGWETTASTNLGLDVIVVDQRISAEFDVYNADTKNILVKRNIPQITGYSNVWTNIGGLNNKGIEIALSTVNIKGRDLRWDSRILFSLNRNKITDLYGDGTERDISNSWFKGQPITAIYNYEVEGVWQEADLFNGSILPGYYPGMYKLKDLNGDGAIDANNDRDIVGYTDPNYRFGINNSISYKGFNLSFFINSIQGGGGYYQSNVYDIVAPAGANVDFSLRCNRPAIYPYWTPDNPVNNIPAMYYAPPIRPSVLMSRSFVRLQDVTLSYNVGKAALKKVGVNNLQVYVSGKNLYLWSDWPGWDPEDDSTPMMRSIIGGLKLSF
jgi:TonB-linked SusC/RagA family outer membrane protein